jgi:hypothetical protein
MRRILIAVLTLAVLASACHHDDGGTATPGTTLVASAPELDAITKATTAAAPLKLSGTTETHLAGGQDRSGPIDGTVTPTSGSITIPYALPSGASASLGILWKDNRMWFNRAIDPAAAAGFSRVTRAAADRPWAQVPMFMGTTLLGIVDPFTALQRVTQAGADVVGTEDHDGQTWTHYRTTKVGPGLIGGAPGTSPVGTVPTVGTVPAPVGSIDLWVDADHVLQRVTAESTTVKVDYTLTAHASPDVTPPAADQIAVEAPSPPDTTANQPAGPYTTMGSGTSDGTAWTLLRAPSQTGGICVRLDLTPAGRPVQPGTAWCNTAPDPGANPEDVILFAPNTPADQPVNGVAVVYPGGTTPKQIGFADRTLLPLNPSGDGFAVWVGPAQPQPVFISMTYTGGVKLGCGAGAMTDLADLDQLAAQLPAMRTQPWTCIEV